MVKRLYYDMSRVNLYFKQCVMVFSLVIAVHTTIYLENSRRASSHPSHTRTNTHMQPIILYGNNHQCIFNWLACEHLNSLHIYYDVVFNPK